MRGPIGLVATLRLPRCTGQATNSGLAQGKKVFTTEVASCFSLPNGELEARQCYPDLVFVPDPGGASAILRRLIGRMQSVGLLSVHSGTQAHDCCTTPLFL